MKTVVVVTGPVLADPSLSPPPTLKKKSVHLPGGIHLVAQQVSAKSTGIWMRKKFSCKTNKKKLQFEGSFSALVEISHIYITHNNNNNNNNNNNRNLLNDLQMYAPRWASREGINSWLYKTDDGQETRTR